MRTPSSVVRRSSASGTSSSPPSAGRIEACSGATSGSLRTSVQPAPVPMVTASSPTSTARPRSRPVTTWSHTARDVPHNDEGHPVGALRLLCRMGGSAYEGAVCAGIYVRRRWQVLCGVAAFGSDWKDPNPVQLWRAIIHPSNFVQESGD